MYSANEELFIAVFRNANNHCRRQDREWERCSASLATEARYLSSH